MLNNKVLIQTYQCHKFDLSEMTKVSEITPIRGRHADGKLHTSKNTTQPLYFTVFYLRSAGSLKLCVHLNHDFQSVLRLSDALVPLQLPVSAA